MVFMNWTAPRAVSLIVNNRPLGCQYRRHKKPRISPGGFALLPEDLWFNGQPSLFPTDARIVRRFLYWRPSIPDRLLRPWNKWTIPTLLLPWLAKEQRPP